MKAGVYVLFGLALLLLVLLRFYGRRYLGFEMFQSGGGSNGKGGKEVVIVKAAWCGHCKKAAPEFQRLVSASPIRLSDGSEVKVRMLDDKADSTEVQGLGVKGFPTILYFSNGQKTEYSGPRTYDGVMGFLQATA
jgi:thiol-disulfide isomerase/thioredoxin